MSASAPAVVSVSSTPPSPDAHMSHSPADAAAAAARAAKQLHPSQSQLATEATLGVPGAVEDGGAAASSTAEASAPLLAAPKPVVIETRTGPVSPRVSPRGLNLNRSPQTRSPAYSNNSSPRASSRSLLNPERLAGIAGGSINMSGVDEVSSLSVLGPSVERRSSGGSAAMAGLLSTSPLGAGNGGANSGATGSLSPAPVMVRRASKPFVLSNGNNSALQSLLSRFTVADIIAQKNASPTGTPAHPHPATVIELASTATPAEGFELLLRNNILSCPVYDAAAKTYIGFLDVRDLVSSIVFAHDEQQLTSSFHDKWNELMLAGMQRFGTAVSVTYLSRRNPFRPCAQSATLLQVARALSTQLHRVPVVDESGKCIAIISQSSLIQFLNEHKQILADDLRQTIGSLGLGVSKVVSVASDASAWQAFKTLEVNSVSGIAIVDRDGKLVGNTSARDLKFFVLNRGTLSLDAPIQDYLSRIRQRDLSHEEARHPSCSIGLSTALGHCIGLLAATGYHRVFVVDVSGRPVGVVSITDILRFASAESAGAAAASSSSSGGSGSNSSTPTTPRSKATSSASAAASPSAATHLRTNSQTHTPVLTPLPKDV